MLERSRLASVKHRAEAQSTVLALASKVQEQNEELSTKQSSLHSTEDNLKLRMMELEGANAQLQVCCRLALGLASCLTMRGVTCMTALQ